MKSLRKLNLKKKTLNNKEIIFLKQLKHWCVVLISISLCHCATINKWWFDDHNEENSDANLGATGVPSNPAPTVMTSDDNIRFSENPNIGTFNERKYKRSTRKSLEEESDIGSKAGSLWNTEGPSAYLFSQNKLHREGDLLNVKLEGQAKNQVETKIGVIKKLLARLEIINSQSTLATNNASDGVGGAQSEVLGGREPAGAITSSNNSGATMKSDSNQTNSVDNQKKQVINSANSSNPIGNYNSNLNSSGLNKIENSSLNEIDAPINIESVSTRVAERMSDGNYRVKGQQSFMIGKKEFRVILTGLVRPEDFSDEGISSNKLLDPQVDIVSLRRSIQ